MRSIGASGGTFALIGATLACGWVAAPTMQHVREQRDVALVCLAYALRWGFTARLIDDAAHAGGASAGFLAVLALRYRRVRRDPG